MFYDFIYLAKGIRMRPKVRSTLNSSKSHAGWLIELNARAILRELPQGRSVCVDSNGRIKPCNVNGNRAEASDINA